MLKKIIDKRNYIILGIIIILLIFIFINNNQSKEYIKTFNYFDETLTIKIYSNKNGDKIFKNIDNIYKKYQKYYQNPNNSNDKELIKMLKYGKKLYDESNGLIDITAGALIKQIENDENIDFKTNIDQLDFDNPKTLNNLDIELIVGSYASQKVSEYLEKNNINKYIINEDGNIIAGKRYGKEKYIVSINNSDGKIIDFAYLENKSMATKGNTNSFKPYMVNPITKNKSENNKLVVVIADDINTANFLADILYLMDIKEGEKFIKNYKAEALWQDDKVQMTSGFKNYLHITK